MAFGKREREDLLDEGRSAVFWLRSQQLDRRAGISAFAYESVLPQANRFVAPSPVQLSLTAQSLRPRVGRDCIFQSTLWADPKPANSPNRER
jgi:hypothetical protein